MADFVEYRVVDYLHETPSGREIWKNTDPKDFETDGGRMGQGNNPPSTEDIELSPYLRLGFKDSDGDWHYYWVDGPFDSDFWLDDAIGEIVSEYGIVMGEEFSEGSESE